MFVDFLETKRSRGELRIVLSVLREFKEMESGAEFAHSSFRTWEKLEMIEEYLIYLTTGDIKKLQKDTVRYIKKNKPELYNKILKGELIC